MGFKETLDDGANRATQIAPLNLTPSAASPLQGLSQSTLPGSLGHADSSLLISLHMFSPSVFWVWLLLVVVLCLRQGLTTKLWLAWNLRCSPGWPQAFSLALCLCVCGSGVPGMHRHAQLPPFPDYLRLPSVAPTLVRQHQLLPGTSWKVLSCISPELTFPEVSADSMVSDDVILPQAQYIIHLQNT